MNIKKLLEELIESICEGCNDGCPGCKYGDLVVKTKQALAAIGEPVATIMINDTLMAFNLEKELKDGEYDLFTSPPALSDEEIKIYWDKHAKGKMPSGYKVMGSIGFKNAIREMQGGE